MVETVVELYAKPDSNKVVASLLKTRQAEKQAITSCSRRDIYRNDIVGVIYGRYMLTISKIVLLLLRALMHRQVHGRSLLLLATLCIGLLTTKDYVAYFCS